MLLCDFQALGFSGDIRTLALAAGFVGRYSDSQHVFGRHLDARRLLSVHMSPDNARRVRFTPGNSPRRPNLARKRPFVLESTQLAPLVLESRPKTTSDVAGTSLNNTFPALLPTRARPFARYLPPWNPV